MFFLAEQQKHCTKWARLCVFHFFTRVHSTDTLYFKLTEEWRRDERKRNCGCPTVLAFCVIICSCNAWLTHGSDMSKKGYDRIPWSSHKKNTLGVSPLLLTQSTSLLTRLVSRCVWRGWEGSSYLWYFNTSWMSYNVSIRRSHGSGLSLTRLPTPPLQMPITSLRLSPGLLTDWR